MKTSTTIRRELRRVEKAKRSAAFVRNREAEDWLYGAETALSWALGEDTMAPAKAFAALEEKP